MEYLARGSTYSTIRFQLPGTHALFILKFHATPTREEMRASLRQVGEQMQACRARGERFGLMVETTGIDDPSLWMGSEAFEFKQRFRDTFYSSQATAIVATLTFVRGIINTYLKHAVSPAKVVDTDLDALEFLAFDARDQPRGVAMPTPEALRDWGVLQPAHDPARVHDRCLSEEELREIQQLEARFDEPSEP